MDGDQNIDDMKRRSKLIKMFILWHIFDWHKITAKGLIHIAAYSQPELATKIKWLTIVWLVFMRYLVFYEAFTGNRLTQYYNISKLQYCSWTKL